MDAVEFARPDNRRWPEAISVDVQSGGLVRLVGQSWNVGAMEVWYWSMKPADLQRVNRAAGWVSTGK